MPRTRIIPDSRVFAILREIIATHGEAAGSFRAVGRATGLAPATLVQRYGSAAGMLRAAMIDGWDIADATLQRADAEAPKTAKGASALLKALPATPMMSRDPQVMARAVRWRKQVIKTLTTRLGSGQAAAILFAAWQGRVAWAHTADQGFSLRDVVRRIT
jgi:AcrR family transcriptional regulator